MLASLVALAILSTQVQAQLFVSPTEKAEPGRWMFGGLVGMATVEYDADVGVSGDIERTLVGGYAARGVNDTLDFFAGGAYIPKAEAEDYYLDDDGDGSMVGVGLRARINALTAIQLSAYGQLHLISESYGSFPGVGGDVDGTITELLAGVATVLELEQLALYGALEVVPFSDGEIDFPFFGTVDIERDSLVVVRLGGNMQLGESIVRAEIGLGGEQTVTVAFGKQF